MWLEILCCTVVIMWAGILGLWAYNLYREVYKK